MDGNLWVILLIATVILFFFIFGWMAILEIRDIYSLGVRVENALIASGWAGLSQVDLMKMGERLDVDDLEGRELYLNKAQAQYIVESYILQNLRLDSGLRALPDSFIQDKQQPVIIEEIIIYNPNELPALTSDGIRLTRTTIHIIALIPKEIKFYGPAYLRKSVPVDIESFLANNQI